MKLLFTRKKILSVLAVLTLVSFSLMIPLAFAAGEADLETMKAATVRVVITLQGQYIGHGSGFVIDDGNIGFSPKLSAIFLYKDEGFRFQFFPI